MELKLVNMQNVRMRIGDAKDRGTQQDEKRIKQQGGKPATSSKQNEQEEAEQTTKREGHSYTQPQATPPLRRGNNMSCQSHKTCSALFLTTAINCLAAADSY